MNTLINFTMTLFQTTASTTIVYKQVDNVSKKDKILFFIGMFIYTLGVSYFIKNEFRFLAFILALFVLMFIIFKIRDKKVILYTFNTIILLAISEIFVTILLVLFGFDSVKLVNNPVYNLLANILISLFAILLVNLGFVKNIIGKMKGLYDKNKRISNYFSIVLVIIYLVCLKNGLELILKSNYYINILFIIGVVFITTLIIKNEAKYDKLAEANKQMLNYVTKYEKIITDQGKTNHEFKNQLMVIRGYAQMKSDKLLEYIDSIADDTKNTHSSYLISQLNKFPDGGVKGLLYYKLLTMDEEKIKYEINSETGVKTKLNTLSVDQNKDLTKILGVLLDNAIDASKKVSKKEIIIAVKKESKYVCFEIYNTYKGKIDLNKIGSGYSSKGQGHGYGLKLVRDIIKNSDIFELENTLEDGYYVARLKVNSQTKKKKK